MVKLEVIDPGLFTTVQDSGRPGNRKFGVPVSGAMDERSMMLANRLADNPDNYPVLEFTLKGGKYRFHSDALIAITGAEAQAKLNGATIAQNEAVSVEKGSLLEMGFFKMGCRAYLSVQGLMNIEPVMASYSTYTTGHFGGFRGRALEAGDELEWSKGEKASSNSELTAIALYKSHQVRLMKGPEWEWLDEGTKQRIMNTGFKVSAKSNRMGIRLEGYELHAPDREMRSSPVLPGIIQLPPDGNPIILMKDGQTIGGYPRIAIVQEQELWKPAQLRPGEELHFKFE